MLSRWRHLRSGGALGAESGFTLVELLTAAFVGLITLTVGLMILQVTSQGSERVAGVVEANQRIRPAMRTIVDELHSACIAPQIAPILPGSTGEKLIALHDKGADVTPVPDKVETTFTGNTLTRSRYAVTGGSEPNWIFDTTPYETRVVKDQLRLAYIGDPGQTVPVFQYFAFAGGALDPDPLPTPLSVTDAQKTVLVSVAFGSGSVTTGEQRSLDPASIKNDVSLRFTPASDGVTEENLPCA